MERNGKGRGRVTRDEVARLAGVSTAVVSYVVNNGPRPVSEAARRRVENAIEILGYRPSASARALALGTADTFGLIVPEITNTFHAQVVEAVEGEALGKGKSVILANSHTDPALERRLLEEMADRGVGGVMLITTSTSDDELVVQNLGVPLVLIDRQRPLPGFATIGPDYRAGGRLATQHLLDHGYTDILPIHGVAAESHPNDRLSGYNDAMLAAGLVPRAPLVVSWTREGGYEAGRRIVREGTMPRAVFSLGDMISIGLLAAFYEARIRVPEDVAVVSFDSTMDATYSCPPLTAVRQPVEQTASRAIARLAASGPVEPGHELLPVSLDVRSSCGC